MRTQLRRCKKNYGVECSILLRIFRHEKLLIGAKSCGAKDSKGRTGALNRTGGAGLCIQKFFTAIGETGSNFVNLLKGKGH